MLDSNFCPMDLSPKIEWEVKADMNLRDLIAKYMSDMRGNIMPPSIFTDNLNASFRWSGTQDPETKRFTPAVELTARWDVMPAWYRVLDRWTELHGEATAKKCAAYRSQLAFACGALRVNELQRKLDKFGAAQADLHSIMKSRELCNVRDELVGHLGDVIKREVKKLSIGAHTYSFIKEHKDSSVKSGTKWPEMTELRLEALLHDTKLLYTEIAEKWDDCRLSSKLAYTFPSWMFANGLRARTPDGLDAGAISFDGTVTRSRMIGFGPAISSFWAFYPEGQRIYKEVVERAVEVTGLPIVCPVVEGAKVWSLMRDQLDKGHEYRNFDGSNWDANVTAVLDMGAPFGRALGPAVMLDSGCSFTSIGGFLAHAVLAVELSRQCNPELMIMLGDDCGWATSRGSPREISGLYEEDKVGTELQHILGWCMLDRDYWHPVGFKATIDRANRSFALQEGRVLPDAFALRGKYSESERRITEGMYCGVIGEKSVREVLDKVDLAGLDVLSPSTVRETALGLIV